MAASERCLVRLWGVSGDKQKGIAELQLSAEHGHYLAPFARILLAIAYVREKDKIRARKLLVSLRNEFPQNPSFLRKSHASTLNPWQEPTVSPSAAWRFIRNLQFCNHPVTINIEPSK